MSNAPREPRLPVVSPTSTRAQWVTSTDSRPVTPAHDAEITSDTSLEDLRRAILGDQPEDDDDRRQIVEAVEAQVRSVRTELGLPEPKPAPPPVRQPIQRETTGTTAVFAMSGWEEPREEPESGWSLLKKVPRWLGHMAALTKDRLPAIVVLVEVVRGITRS